MLLRFRTSNHPNMACKQQFHSWMITVDAVCAPSNWPAVFNMISGVSPENPCLDHPDFSGGSISPNRVYRRSGPRSRIAVLSSEHSVPHRSLGIRSDPLCGDLRKYDDFGFGFRSGPIPVTSRVVEIDFSCQGRRGRGAEQHRCVWRGMGSAEYSVLLIRAWLELWRP